MTHYETAEDKMPLDELIEWILSVWLNPRHPDAWNGHVHWDDELYDAHEFQERRPSRHRLPPVFGYRTSHRSMRGDEHGDYQVIRARDLCEAFHEDSIIVATRNDHGQRDVSYRTIHSREYLERNDLLAERREQNEKIKAASTPQALRAAKEREEASKKALDERRRETDRRRFGIGGKR